jgi:hypothetical protein
MYMTEDNVYTFQEKPVEYLPSLCTEQNRRYDSNGLVEDK